MSSLAYAPAQNAQIGAGRDLLRFESPERSDTAKGEEFTMHGDNAAGAKFFGTVMFILLLVGAVVGFLQFVHVWGKPTDKDPTTIEDPRDREMPETNPLRAMP